MNYGRGFPLPRYDNRKPWIPAMGIPLENEIGQNQGSWASAMLGGQISQVSEGVGETPRRVIARDDGIRCVRGSELESWITRSTENGVVGNGIVQNSENRNRAIPTNLYSQGNGNGNGEVSSSWTPVTPGKLIPQKSNLVMSNKPWNQGGNENWENLVGIYQHVLQRETLNLNEVAQDNYQNNENENRLASTANRNLNQIPGPNRNHGSNQASHSVPYFPSKDPANWDDSLLAAIVGPKKSLGSNLFIKRPLNNSLHNLNETPVQNSSTQIGSVLGNQQSPTVHSNKLQTDGFPVPYHPCYNLNSPSRSEHDAALSGITGPLPFAPITPDTQQKHVDGQWVPVKDRHETQRIKDVDNHNIGDSSSSAVPTTQKEHLVLEEEGELGIDLNKTPNQKTPARRKKHRPKVIIEGKPKRTRTPKDPKNKAANETRVKRKYVRRTPQGNGVEINPKVERKYASRTPQGNGVEITPRVKRKYVRKKGVDQSNSQKKTQQEETAKPVVENPAKSCKRQLNFDLECVEGNASQTRSEYQGINLNDNAQDIEKERRINSILKRSAMKVAQNNMYAGVTAHQEMQPELNGQSMPMAKAQDHALNVIARNLILRKSVPNQGNWRNRCIQVGPVSTTLEGNQRNGQIVNFDEARGIKRPLIEQINPRTLNATDSIYMYQKLLLGGDNRVDCSSNDLTRIMQSHKKTKMQNDHSTPCSDDNSRGDSGRPNGVYGNTAALQLLYSCTERVNQSYQVNEHHFQAPMATATQNLQKPLGATGMQPIMDRPQRLTQTQGHGVNSVTAMVSWNKPPATPPKDYSRSAVLTSPATLLNKNGTAMQYSSSQRSNEPDKMLLQLRRDTPQAHQISFMKPKGGPRKKKGVLSVEDITFMLESLCIYDESEKERNALVPYRGDNNNNAIIPFEPIKKRKPRAKVDLDPETDRLWRLLMGKEGSEAAETMDKDKEKWWEDERRVFRGRADSFIARMHLVQGDRRFSRWKGSVVDSVIGVFLTQNVSDHLSSSAFMSLAAKFTLKTTTTNTTRCEDGACVLVEEPIETILPTDQIGRQPIFNLSSFVSCESTEQLRYNISSSSNSAANKHNMASEEVILSQDSLDSSTIQTVDEIRSSSGSNSEAEDQPTGFETSQEPTPPNPTQAQKVSMFKELFSHDNRTTQINNRSQYMHHIPKTPVQIPIISGVNSVNSASRFTPPNSSEFEINMTTGSQNMGSCDFRLLGGESISSLPSSNKSGMTGRYHTSNVTYQQNETARFHELPQGRQYDFLSNHPQPHTGGVHDINRNHRPSTKADIIVQKQDSCSEDRVSTVDKENCVQNVAAEANSKERNYGSHDPLNRPDKSTLKGGKGTGEDEKNGFDWDSLRRDVLLKSEKRERSKDARDSLDYEALRRAHVNEISDAIRERGMNNLLADRIKAFLDRLVRDHGSIDLEWLRDVPPDKAKDYLLSIRGLGLKSVECVRLLTLHHLAFPVDTNVGRIAVRLGWVPLQPLPESLQLHLLEMYPVLESIQKYLWPRLCKLDQLTLYELHYQMITFGKVFCTKSKPNCNACPMRAECRHFSSAFASARLALPGPEEKRIVPSDASNTQNSTYTTPPVISRPMPLPPAENCNNNAQFFNEPIIEEPTTPEPEAAELAISDIEDQYYDDADEIPTIKLDMNEFTANLQKMQNSTDIRGDMSKALVALNPQAASIPTPKLKNVSRLRTEHLVYELPDSHPLLEGLYKREPDDPSPYLLAIWTPGETAHSMQPPERGCQAQESGMLCDRTTCFSCNCIKEANSQMVRGTILMPCRTATRGSFPLNGTYFQVNEMFADHASSLNPIDVPRAWIWNLPRRTVYFGTSVSTIFKGLTTQEIQQCFWRGFVCVRGFDQKMRAPRPLMARLHFPASKLVKTKNDDK